MITPITAPTVEASPVSPIVKATGGAKDAPKSFTEALAETTGDAIVANGDALLPAPITGAASAVLPYSVGQVPLPAPIEVLTRPHHLPIAADQKGQPGHTMSGDTSVAHPKIDPSQAAVNGVETAFVAGLEPIKNAYSSDETEQYDETILKKKAEAEQNDPKRLDHPDAHTVAPLPTMTPILPPAPIPAQPPAPQASSVNDEKRASHPLIETSVKTVAQSTTPAILQTITTISKTEPSKANGNTEGGETGADHFPVNGDQTEHHLESHPSVAKEIGEPRNHPPGVTAGAPLSAPDEKRQKISSDDPPIATGSDPQGMVTASQSLARGVPLPPHHEIINVATTPWKLASPDPVPYGMLPIEIGMGALQGQRAIEVRLSPEDLGTVEIRLSVSDDSKLSADIKADRPETLAMMIRDAPLLRNALDQTGLTTTPETLQFSLKQDGGFGQGNGSQAEQRHTNGQTPSDNQQGTPHTLPHDALPTVSLRRAAGLLDVHI